MFERDASREQAYIEAMGSDLGVRFYALQRELIWLHWRWHQYRLLFGTSESRVELLNEAAPLLFLFVHEALFDQTLLGLARLTGSARTMGKANLSIEQLRGVISDSTLMARLEPMITDAQAAAAFAKDWRNRAIAHVDLTRALGNGAPPLAAASRERIEVALKHLRDLLNAVEGHFCRGITGYPMLPHHGDAESLLYILRDGLRAEQARQERWARGEFCPEDDLPHEPV